MPSANPPCGYAAPPNGRPSPLSLRDISPHCGESPFARGAYVLTFFASLKREVATPQGVDGGIFYSIPKCAFAKRTVSIASLA